MDERRRCETGIHQNPRGEYGQQPLRHWPKQHDTSPKARETKDKMNLWDFIKIKNFCTSKETVRTTKRQPMEWENIFANETTHKRLISKIYKELLKLNT